MIIVAGGDSFVFGSELADCEIRRSKSTFTALLSKGSFYKCVARPGFSNHSISRTVLEKISERKQSNYGVVVSWTYTSRYEFNFSSNEQPIWQTVTPWTVNNFYPSVESHNENIIKEQKQFAYKDFANTWYKFVGSFEYWEIYSTLKEIVFLQNYLTIQKIPFMFTCADASWLETKTYKSMDRSISSLRNQIDFTKWFFFPGYKGFYQWAVDNKYPIGNIHPLEEAHRDAAELMKDKFYELVKKHLE